MFLKSARVGDQNILNLFSTGFRDIYHVLNRKKSNIVKHNAQYIQYPN